MGKIRIWKSFYGDSWMLARIKANDWKHEQAASGFSFVKEKRIEHEDLYEIKLFMEKDR